MSDGPRIVRDDLAGPAIARFLAEHLEEMRAVTPPGSVHALDLDALRRPEVAFWSLLDGDTVLACGALKRLDPAHAELKSMRTAPAHRGRGLGARMLAHLLAEAARAGYRRVSLETGSFAFFAPARALYQRWGFTPCPPFADYTDDPNSSYLTRTLTAR